MHEAALAQAALPTPVRILRLPLLPYSLGHELFLIRTGNPLVLLAEAAFNQLPIAKQIEAICGAALACSQTWRQNTTQAHRWLRLWHWFNRHANWPLEIAEFRNYLAAGSAAFKADLPSGHTTGSIRYLGAPELLSLHQWIIQNIPESQWPTVPLSNFPFPICNAPKCAWDYPLALARMQKQCAEERAGELQIYNYRDWVHDNFVAEMEAQRIAEEKAKADSAPSATADH